ncbi:MAG: cytidine deaminase [Vampirovibrionales bacterium]|nr:cytidine deaminase [Vampirovibrionales bacterium]
MVTDYELLLAAQKASKSAYCPYSHFSVGAAVLASRHQEDAPDAWQLFRGCNIENISYGLTVCAERVAVSTAVAEGFRVIHRIAVWAQHTAHHKITPCGACRQVLAEFMPANAHIIMASAHNKPQVATMNEFLPEAFSTPTGATLGKQKP